MNSTFRPLAVEFIREELVLSMSSEKSKALSKGLMTVLRYEECRSLNFPTIITQHCSCCIIHVDIISRMDNSRKKIKVEDVKIKEEEQDYIAETDEDDDTGNKKSST